MKKLKDYKIWELRELAEDQKNYKEIERLCCENEAVVECIAHWIQGKPVYIGNIKNMVEALVDIKEAQWPEGKYHILYCDEYHAHRAPECCSSKCWCREEYDKPN